MRNNPFGKGDPRFDYQKHKVNTERYGPTGDWNVNMNPVKDEQVMQKRDNIAQNIQFYKESLVKKRSAIFASMTERNAYERLNSLTNGDIIAS